MQRNNWDSHFNDISLISPRYKRKLNPIKERRYYCGVNIDCSSYESTKKEKDKQKQTNAARSRFF